MRGIQPILIFIFVLLLKDLNAQFQLNPLKGNFHISVGAESRKDDFNWSIAGDQEGKNPNILSELNYTDIKAAGFHTNISYQLHRRFSIEADYTGLFTYDGSATDFDYAEDNRTAPTTELYLTSDKGNFSSGGAHAFYDIISNKPWLLKTGAGYSFTRELFYLLDDYNEELQTTYLAKWKGPGFILEGAWVSPLKIDVGTRIKLNVLKYDATANWNIQEQFQQPVSFIQRANGKGWDVSARLGYQFHKNIRTDAAWLYADWRTQPGLDRLFLKSGETPETMMNGAFKKNSGWRLSVTYTL
ncbi:hypothetical protein ABDK00_009010 [Niabella insulamsoli]|uniref:hypothetical protein n=1 Tax=Niabella insulamsoli TaxID=3144874 RepID=UPI0031FC9058